AKEAEEYLWFGSTLAFEDEDISALLVGYAFAAMKIDDLDEIEISGPIVIPPFVELASGIRLSQPGEVVVDIDDIFRPGALDFRDHFFLHSRRERLRFRQWIHVNVTSGRVAVRIKIYLRLRTNYSYPSVLCSPRANVICDIDRLGKQCPPVDV